MGTIECVIYVGRHHHHDEKCHWKVIITNKMKNVIKNDPLYQDDKSHWKIIISIKMTFIKKSSLLSGLCLFLSVLASPHRQRVNCNSNIQRFYQLSFFFNSISLVIHSSPPSTLFALAVFEWYDFLTKVVVGGGGRYPKRTLRRQQASLRWRLRT